ncbi:hypothetical protein BLA24_20130 [Streptomyces cinnamoneus]|uniref:Uncharacterized protein n=1 Tax=Streptomyces cinnamoneus TaxID=53446 RepID=A0A2G1XFB4_STRCJ|nr:hypothetical protein [Streptomyces cinnamoneus]PHQ49936.1 hypothetical protein BLA24_20130 [Streptomyces cinnamoneus]PPT13288.1 hypothetical protein CYQ11_10660 [Streptomyces cinnamoneus]
MTREGAPMAMALRGLLMAGGVAVMVLGVVLLFFWHAEVVELTGAPRLVSALGLRAAEAAVLYGGSWLVVRGWNGGPRRNG